MSLIISRWDYKPQHEPCMYGWKGKNRKWTGRNNISTVWDIARQQGNSGEQRNHPTQKPVECMARPIRNHSGDVYDPFGGSGTTMVASHQLGRNCYMIEIMPAYCQIILDRMLKLDNTLKITKNGKPFKAPINASDKETGKAPTKSKGVKTSPKEAKING